MSILNLSSRPAGWSHSKGGTICEGIGSECRGQTKVSLPTNPSHRPFTVLLRYIQTNSDTSLTAKVPGNRFCSACTGVRQELTTTSQLRQPAYHEICDSRGHVTQRQSAARACPKCVFDHTGSLQTSKVRPPPQIVAYFCLTREMQTLALQGATEHSRGASCIRSFQTSLHASARFRLQARGLSCHALSIRVIRSLADIRIITDFRC
ncbi:hypothetical protein B0T24DRAFT_43705 [Lasiosphaeria ovina]|uniref:Uncharacterized protein n=1 Tax=Lasiosphaeria ovina TaxID=92902 RepID=A0AAE0NKS4_9PEZI|nr:hypothetical protein B0T24DRAFT_43705 [Lasiosphaeria ovina]